MAGKSKKEMHPFFAELMTQRGWRNLTEMSRDTGISVFALRQYAYDGCVPQVWLTTFAISESLGVPVETFMRGLMQPEERRVRSR